MKSILEYIKQTTTNPSKQDRISIACRISRPEKILAERMAVGAGLIARKNHTT